MFAVIVNHDVSCINLASVKSKYFDLITWLDIPVRVRSDLSWGYTILAHSYFALHQWLLLLFIFRRRPGWQKLKVVSFAYPLLPAFFVAVGVWMTILGVMLRPGISAIAVLTVTAGAAIYHFKLRKETA